MKIGGARGVESAMGGVWSRGGMSPAATGINQAIIMQSEDD